MEPRLEKRRRRIAAWIGIPGISVWTALRTLDWLFSLGGAEGNAEGWRNAGAIMLSEMPPWLMPSLLAGSGIALLIYLVGVVPVWCGKARAGALRLASTPRGMGKLILVIQITVVSVLALIVAGFFYYVVFVHESPKWIWTHPTLSPIESKKAEAECEVAAYEAIGGGRGGLMDPTPGNRGDYVSNCMTIRGFKIERVR